MVRNIVIWGNHSQDQFPDVSHGIVRFPDGSEQSVRDALAQDEKFLNEEFIPLIQNRGAAVIQARGKSSAMSAANAVKDHMRSWACGTPEVGAVLNVFSLRIEWATSAIYATHTIPQQGEWASMAVISDGSCYDIPAGLVFSVPTICKDGEYTVVTGI